MGTAKSKENVAEQLAELPELSVRELRLRFAELFGDQTRAGNKAWLVKRVAWRLQALDEGDLTERARARALELANDSDIRLTAPKTESSKPVRTRHDRRLPITGSVISRDYKGQKLEVAVLPNGFQYQGTLFKSLSALAKAITGSHCNGYLFFRLSQERQR